jgi:Flp pilus assembly pilin Flp
MMNLMNRINSLKLLRDERGLSTVEYVVLLVLLVIMAVAVWNAFGGMVTRKLQESGRRFDETVINSGDVDREELTVTGTDWESLAVTRE